jgi:hypothetical protein
MKLFFIISLLILSGNFLLAQNDKEQLALKVARAEEQNLTKLKEYIWKRNSNVFLEDQLKLTTITEFKFDESGKLVTTVIDSKTTVQKKPGLRGAAQQSAAEDKLDYIQKALELSVSYAFLSKGELVDFFDKATISEKDGKLEAIASSVLVPGDRLVLLIDPESSLIVFREFSSLLGNDAITGMLYYDKFSNGTVHGSVTTINLPVQKMRLEGANQDYTIRVN